jgi:glycosyltransferase involved in cell wall biosynthesis
MVIPSLSPGGTERQALYLAEGLAPDFEIDVVCTRDAGAWAKQVQPYAEVFEFGISSGWDPRLQGRLARHFRARRPEVVQTYLSGFDYPANVAARRAGVPVIVSSRRELATWKRARHVWLQRWANRRVDAMVANCRAVAEYAARQEGEPLDAYTVIYNGVLLPGEPDRDPRLELTLPRAAPVVGMVANFSPEKDHALFVAVAALVHARRPDAHFVLVGDGPLREETQRAVVNRRLGDVFRFTGARTDATPLYPAFDVAVLTSRTEGLPNTVLEAMAAARPVVAAAVGGVPEIIEHGVTGRLVSTRNAGDFAEAVLKLLDNTVDAAMMGARAAEHARARFSVAAMVSQHRDLYLRLLERPRADGTR